MVGKKNISGNSVIYNVSKDMFMIMDKLLFQVSWLDQDANIVNKIQNEQRIKEVTFKEIQKLYLNRINKYKLTTHRLSNDLIDNLILKGFNFDKSSLESDDSYRTSDGGLANIYPLTFRCSSCGHFIKIQKDKNNQIMSLNPLCSNCNTGEYRQIALIKFCDGCGKYEELYTSLLKTKNLVFLSWDSFEAPLTWKFKLKGQNGKDIIQGPCTHFLYNKEKLSDLPPTRITPVSITSGGFIKPVVITLVDIPNLSYSGDNKNQIIYGIILGKFESLRENLKHETLLEYIENLNRLYKNFLESSETSYETVKEYVSKDEFMNKHKEQFNIDLIEDVISEIKLNYDLDSLEREDIINFYSLKGDLNSNNKVISLSKSIADGSSVYSNLDDYSIIKKKYGLKEINYVSNLNLVSCSIGRIIGPTFKPDDQEFVPHFEPMWQKKSEKNFFDVFVNPSTTEGLLFELDSEKIKFWFEKRSNTKVNCSGNDFLLKLVKDSSEYNLVFKLLHTISHIVIKKLTLHTGLDTDSCNEMLFTSTGSFLIYSTSTVNIGGFGSLFENEILDVFKEFDYHVNNCIYDPVCIEKHGNCFSCLHLPEFVCSHFNNDLDRAVVKGNKTRDEFGFWEN